MQSTCEKCKSNFEISKEELEFIKKVSPVFNGKTYEFPAPVYCPDCRMTERTVHRNEQFMYHNKSAVTGKDLVALYSPNTTWGKNYKIYTNDEWWSDSWDGLDFGRDYDFKQPFFEQFEDLNREIPKANLVTLNNENCQYTTGTAYCKNCYLINCSENCEDCYYGKLIQTCKDVMDSDFAYDSELCYGCFNITKCYNCNFVSLSQNCYDCWFSENLRGCKNCFLCTNLYNKEFYFLNEPLSKEEYNKRVKEFTSSAAKIQESKVKFAELRKKRIFKYANIVNCENSTGDFLTNCKNCEDCFDVNDSEDCKHLIVGVECKDLMDCNNMYIKPELNYQTLGVIETYLVHYSLFVFHSQNVLYSQFCFNSKDLFGCCGLRNQKQYCILNKQYSKKEYEELVPRIIQHMRSTGEWGKYFPPNTSPFGYNETVAHLYIPLTKEEALQKGFKWKDPDKKDYKPQKFILPEEISDIADDITEQILACENCGKNYRIIPQELTRLKKMNIPAPRICPDCRQQERMSLRNPRKIYDDECDKCSSPIKTSFSPGHSEKVYCEKCYLETVY